MRIGSIWRCGLPRCAAALGATAATVTVCVGLVSAARCSRTGIRRELADLAKRYDRRGDHSDRRLR